VPASCHARLVIRIFDAAVNVIETHEQNGEFCGASEATAVASVLFVARDHKVLSDRIISRSPDCMAAIGCDNYAGCKHNATGGAGSRLGEIGAVTFSSWPKARGRFSRAVKRSKCQCPNLPPWTRSICTPHPKRRLEEICLAGLLSP
jgi:hypothetical protein